MKRRGYTRSRGRKISGVKVSPRVKVESLTDKILENINRLHNILPPGKKTFLRQIVEYRELSVMGSGSQGISSEPNRHSAVTIVYAIREKIVQHTGKRLASAVLQRTRRRTS